MNFCITFQNLVFKYSSPSVFQVPAMLGIFSNRPHFFALLSTKLDTDENCSFWAILFFEKSN